MQNQNTIPNLSEKLQAFNIRPSVQRLAIYQFIIENHIHPTADDIYAALAPTIPTLSRTTVYNTLKQFVDCGLVQTLTIEDGILRFDADTANHIHFKCRECGEIFDVYADFSPNEDILPEGFFMEKIQTNIWGLCKSCQPKTETEKRK